MDEVLRTRARANHEIPKRVNLYVGTPYCLPTQPDRCGFCLFPSEIYTGRRQLDEYLEYLELEGDMFRDHFAGAELASVYFGGGTSNLYKAEQYPRLMKSRARGVRHPATDRGHPRGHSPDLQPRQAAGDETERHNADQHGGPAARRRADQSQRPQAARRPGFPDARVVRGARTASQCRPDLRLAEPDDRADGARPRGDRGDRCRPHHALRAQRRRADRLRAAPPWRAAVDRRESRDVSHGKGGARSLRLHPGDGLRLRAAGCGLVQRVSLRRIVSQAVPSPTGTARSGSTPGAGVTPPSRSSSAHRSHQAGR